MAKLTNEEMKEIMETLEKSGMNPRWCNTPVPYYDVCVQAGVPTDPGYIEPAEMVWMSDDLAKQETIILGVKGESMRDAGICPGDRIVVQYGVEIRDGDIVVASIGEESTVKTYMTDEYKNRWLVPHNPDFSPILLTEEMGRIRMGKVVQVIKCNPRVGYTEIMRIIKEASGGMKPKKEPVTRRRAEEVIREMGDEVMQVRQWFAVFRAMVDAEVLRDDDYDAFVRMVSDVLPTHERLPVTPELRRMAVQSFRKPVDRWNGYDAPVSGYRFEAYLRIAKDTASRLME